MTDVPAATDHLPDPRKRRSPHKRGTVVFPLIVASMPTLLVICFMTLPVMAAKFGHDGRQSAYRELQQVLLSETPAQRADMSAPTVERRKQVATELIVRDFTGELQHADGDLNITDDERRQIIAIRTSGAPIVVPIGPFAEAEEAYYRSFNPWLHWWAWFIPPLVFAVLYFSASRQSRRIARRDNTVVEPNASPTEK